MHLSQQCHQLTHVSVCERMTVFYLDSRDLLLTQNSTSPALGAEVRIEPHALQKQETASALQYDDRDCAVASCSLVLCFPCVMGFIAKAAASCLLVLMRVGRICSRVFYISSEVLLCLIIVFFLPCAVGLPDTNYLCYYVQIFLFDSEILFHTC